jgi:hypothetical protein
MGTATFGLIYFFKSFDINIICSDKLIRPECCVPECVVDHERGAERDLPTQPGHFTEVRYYKLRQMQ